MEYDYEKYCRYKKYILKWPINVQKMKEEAFIGVVEKLIVQMEYVKSKDLFDEEYYTQMYPEVLEFDITPIEHYFLVGFICDNNNAKNPNKYFNTIKYQEKIKDKVRIIVNPLYHYALSQNLVKSIDDINEEFDRYEKFVFSDDVKVIKVNGKKEAIEGKGAEDYIDFKVLIHIHCYYVDLVEEMLKRFLLIKDKIDFVITTNTIEKENEINEILKNIGIKANVFVVENRGRDVGPFYVGLKKIYKEYDILLHLHTKKSPRYKVEIGWFEDMLDKLALNEDYIINLLKLFKRNNNLGIIIPSLLNHIRKETTWGDNYSKAKELVQKMGYDEDELDKFMLKFSAGNMFWARTKAIEPIFSLDLEFSDFPEEPIEDDGTIAHSLERLPCFVAEQKGYFSCAIEPK